MTTPTHRGSPWLRALRRCGLPLALALVHALAPAAPTRDRVSLLVPDDADPQSWPVRVWLDTAAEEGLRLELVTDAQLLAMGATAAERIAGLIVPDSAHVRASDAVVAALKQYAYTGGQLMLVYDAAAQTEQGFFPLAGPSRLSDLVGVDYVLWDNGAGAATMVGFGPVVGTASRMDALSLPPGKTLPWASVTAATLGATAVPFVPASQDDPGARRSMTPLMRDRASKGIEDGSANLRHHRRQALRSLLGLGTDNTSALRWGPRRDQASRTMDQLWRDRGARLRGDLRARVAADGRSYTELATTEAVVDDGALQVISGYAYGPLNYFSYVTRGSFPGTVYLSSPDHGLVAGQRSYGSGQLLFVNLPLGYFKAIGTDSAPLHGFLGLFAREQVGVASLSTQPGGRGGLIYNWHIDDGDDLTVNTRDLLNRSTVLYNGPFSLHLTAGPDAVTPGDGLGMNLPGNPAARDLLRRLSNTGLYGSPLNFFRLPAHEIGSHGGWIHDYWGAVASEANVPDLTPLLQRNFDAIEGVTGRRIREYSSPVGNTPTWAVKWLEARGVVAMYLVGDLGAGMLRSWRNGERLTDKLWTSPVSPLGRYATFEEFDEFGIGDAVSGQWLLDLQSFVVNKRSNRMFYNHPPGAAGHLDPVNLLLGRARRLEAAGRFDWYTMAQMADFSQRRIQTSFDTSRSGAWTTFNVRNPAGLAGVTWLLPLSRFSQPQVTQGSASVSSDARHWLVHARAGTALQFMTVER